jgi:hypothetical protein
MDAVRFRGQVRFWKPEQVSGLAVIDVPGDAVAALGGLKQQRVHGSIAGAAFTSNVMPAGGGRLALSVSKAMMAGAGVAVGDDADVTITRVGKD